VPESSLLPVFAAHSATGVVQISSRSQEKVAMQRIGPHNPGLSRLLAARFLVLLMVSFYVAGLAIALLYGLGKHPLS
jgi:hypothetical protein